MSVHVLSRFLKESQAELGARLVGTVMAHAAGDDGICWKSQENLTQECHLSVRGVRDAIRKLEELGEIETRKVQRGRSRVNVYRIWCADPPEYERLPFTVKEPFSELPPAESAASDDRQSEARPPADHDHDDRQIAASTPLTERKENVSDSAAVAAVTYDPLKGQKIEGRNLPWDALVKATGADEVAEGGRIGKHLKVIRELVVRDSSPQTFEKPETGEWWIARQIEARAGQYRRRWPTMELTPKSLQENWSRVVAPQADQASDLDRDFHRLFGEAS